MSRKRLTRLCKVLFVRTGTPSDRNAFERALRTSQRNGADLTVASVIDEPPAAMLRVIASTGASPEDFTSAGAARDEVNAFVESARTSNVQATGRILKGNTLIESIRMVVRDQHDLLVKAAEPVTEGWCVSFGHLDRQLMRKCPCPVWIDKPATATGYGRILAAVDPDPFIDEAEHDTAREDLNTKILELAILLAKSEEAQLHVVHAWLFDLEGPLQTRAGLAPEAVAKVAQTIERRHKEALAELLKPHMPSISHVHLLKGRPWEVVPLVVARESADLLVMGTVCRTGIAGLLIGNTAETVLDQVDCSLLALKPSGFVSPVEID